jgi:hypothetical protein
MSETTQGKYPVGTGDNSQQEGKSASTDNNNLGASNSDFQDASASRGGTTDMDHRSHRGATGETHNNSAGSGMASKTSVTGSDFDGQVVDQ